MSSLFHVYPPLALLSASGLLEAYLGYDVPALDHL